MVQHILIIEDDERVASLIRRGMEEFGFQTTIAYDGQSGAKLIAQHAYDLIIMDIILPKMDGIALCKDVKKQYPAIPIIMLTALGTTDDKLEGFDAGADDYLVKPFDFRELHARVRALLKRGGNAEEYGLELNMADLTMNLHTKSVSRAGKELHLTPTEFRLLEFMLKNPNRVLSRAEIAEHVWNTHYDTGTNFIDVYINYLRKKMDKGFAKKLIHTKSGMGFIIKQ